MLSGDLLCFKEESHWGLLVWIAPSAINDIRKREITIEQAVGKRKLDLSLTNENVITYTTVAIFLPYILTAIILVFLSIYILSNKHTRQLVFIHRGTRMMKLFFVYALTVPVMYHNWLGVIVGAGMTLALILGLYLRSIMTKELFDRMLRLVCTLSLTSTGYAVLETSFNIMDDGVNKHRIAAVFSHPNYFGTIAATVIIICAYRFLTNKENRWFYCFVAFMNVVSLYLCKSMFAFVEVFIGTAVLLLLLKRRRLFSFWIGGAAIGAVLVFYGGVNLIPRLNDITLTLKIRQDIWKLAAAQIRSNPFFGHGYMSFAFLYHASFRNNLIPHSHSIYFDTMMNFGILGTGLFVWYFIRYYLAVIRTNLKKDNSTVAALIIAVSAAALVHGATDLTLFWIQTLPLFLLILAGQGSEEKEEQFVRGIELI